MKTRIIVLLAVIVNFFLVVGKVIVGLISNSAAILADGINSATDVIASSIGYIGIKAAEKPADKEHPYGHEKAEVISGFIITIIIFISGLWIIYEAIIGFFSDKILSINILAFIIMGISAATNGIMSYVKIYYGKKNNSVSLVSDGIHSRIDLLVSAGIFLGLFLIKYYNNIDSVLALIVGIYILKEAFKLGKETTDSLLGTSAGEEIEKKIKDIIKKQKIELKNLKTQKLGNKIFAEINIKLPAKIKVDEANKITKKLEQELVEKISALNYTAIQIESHDVGRSYYRPEFGRGFGWKRRGRFRKEVDDGENIEEVEGAGPGGECICPKCDTKIKHKRGKPCATIKCPECGAKMTRAD